MGSARVWFGLPETHGVIHVSLIEVLSEEVQKSTYIIAPKEWAIIAIQKLIKWTYREAQTGVHNWSGKMSLSNHLYLYPDKQTKEL